MPGYVGKTTNQQREVIGQQAQSEREDMAGPMPGEVVSYNPATQTATIKPLAKRRKPDGSPLEYPELLEVPIRFPRTGSSAITQPVPVGTRVILSPMARSMENYDTEDDGSPSDSRSFSLADMVASLDGGDSLTSPLANVDPNNMHMRFNETGEFGIKGSPDGKIKIEGNQGNIYDLLATACELEAEGFVRLGTEPTLVNKVRYAEIGDELTEISVKLRAMAL